MYTYFDTFVHRNIVEDQFVDSESIHVIKTLELAGY